MPQNPLRRLSKKFMIISNVIVALLFLPGCYAKWFNPQHWWFIGLLTLSAFYLLLLLLAFIVFWLFANKRWSLISVVTLLLALGPVRNIIPFRFGHAFNMVRQGDNMRVMSWNVAQFDILHSKKDPGIKNDMFDLINTYDPDIACFQEMVCEDSTPPEHGHISEFLQRLKFPDYFYSYNVKEDFWGHAHFGIIIFSKYPMINKQTVKEYPYDYNSIFQYADIVKGADTFRLFNIHLQSLRFSQANLKYIDKPNINEDGAVKESKSIIGKFRTGFLKRQMQAERIKEEMDKSPYPVIVCGDFNDVPNSYAYATIGKGMQNAFVEKGSGIGRTFSGIAPTLRIDNVFVGPEFAVEQYTCVNKKLSDHYPVITDILLNKKQ